MNAPMHVRAEFDDWLQYCLAHGRTVPTEQADGLTSNPVIMAYDKHIVGAGNPFAVGSKGRAENPMLVPLEGEDTDLISQRRGGPGGTFKEMIVAVKPMALRVIRKARGVNGMGVPTERVSTQTRDPPQQEAAGGP